VNPHQNPLPLSTVVAVVGAGAMGAGIAQVAAAAGHRVRLLDSRPGAAEQAVAAIQAQFAKLADKGRLTPEAAQAAGARLLPAASSADLADAGLVIEAIVEHLEVKRGLLRELEAICGPDCILASNTSSISITAIAAGLQRPQRLVGMHFFNPAPLMALVEIVSGLATDPCLAAMLHATAAAWGKTPVHARSTPGFIVNRVARPFYAEGLRLLQEGAADCATLDALMREAGGFRMGPFELMDLIGHDVNFAVTRSVWSAFFHDQRFLPSLVQQELVDAGFLGRKSGRGFYDHAAGAAQPAPATAAPVAVPADLAVCGDSPLAQALAARLQAAGIAFERRESFDGRVAQADAAVLFQTDGRSATQRAAESGIADLALIDLALDYARAPRLAVAVARQASDGARDAALGLLQAAGYAVSLLRDVPGLAVMRTVAMLANEAADAVNQGVCDPAGADAAMRLGVNYPRGPLAWADAVGVGRIHAVLQHLGAFYGEDRYRVSPLIRQAVHAGSTLHD